MLVSSIAPPEKLAGFGLGFFKKVNYQCTPDELVQDTLQMNEGILGSSGALIINTGEFTGRSPKDKFIVQDQASSGLVNWNDFNNPISEAHFDTICTRMKSHLSRLPEIWVMDRQACADKRFRMNIRVIAEKPWAALFAYNMFMQPDSTELPDFEPDWQVFVAPGLKLDPSACGVRNENASVISFKHKMILIAASGYTGEIKKGIFTVLNLILPQFRSVLSMHCSANMGENGDTALFFGLSGTGKTTLSADPSRRLIGDDEHGWTRDNIFNFEGGCYAKVFNLNKEMEPEIFSAIKPGALLENTVCFPGTNEVNYASSVITENTRVSYPLDHISNCVRPAIGSIPSNIFFLTCDAYGVLPPISRLNVAQAMYHFISGYTAKIAGTETGVVEPVSTFSACFGAPFLPLHPGKYATMLGERIRQHKVKVWLVNTGWTGGQYGKGSRISIKFTRAMISAALSGRLEKCTFDVHPIFGMEIPVACPGIPSTLLYPRDTWTNRDEYDEEAANLARKFILNFENYSAGVDDDVRSAGPVIR